nr:hypothetical protein [uncultured Marinifilum sp.]
MRQILPILVLLLLPFYSLGQLESFGKLINIEDEITESKENTEEIKKHDLRKFWFKNKTERRFAYIGDNFQRLKIVFLSVIQNTENPLEYFVYGKSNVSNNVCPFQGKIIIKDSYYIKTLENPTENSGIIIGEYVFFEDPDTNHSGIFKGICTSLWYKDSNGDIKYDNRNSDSDSYNNNQFTGTWTQYGKHKNKTANWGDSRIPESEKLDTGAGEFSPRKEFMKNGWDSYIKAWSGGYSKTETENAQKKEQEKWWKKK